MLKIRTLIHFKDRWVTFKVKFGDNGINVAVAELLKISDAFERRPNILNIISGLV